MKLFKQRVKLVTHNGSFHTDDVFAAAVLIMHLERKGEKYEITRTRDEKIIAAGNYVFDVGGVYDESQNRFDHHQPGGAGRRAESGIEYSSVGLVWQKFGRNLCKEQAVKIIDNRLIAPIDAFDNGIELVENKMEISPYLLQHITGAMHPTWKEETLENDVMFSRCVDFAKEILSREIIQAEHSIEAEQKIVDAYTSAPDKRLIILDKHYPFEYVLHHYPEPLFVIYPRPNGDWGIRTVHPTPKTFKNRKDFPRSWAGLRDLELRQITGVPDAVFCHKGLFLAVAKSKEGAIELAELALKTL